MYRSANETSKRLEEGQRSELKRGRKDGRKRESAYGPEGVKVNESANWFLIFVIAGCVSEVDKTWSAEGFEKSVVTVEDISFLSIAVTWSVKFCIAVAMFANCFLRYSTEADRESGGGVEARVTEESQVKIDAWSACSVLKCIGVDGFAFEFFFLPIEIFSEKEVIYVVIIILI